MKIKIAWLYPELMNTYGDRGNIFALGKKCKENSIDFEIVKINLGKEVSDLISSDILFMGGAQDEQQGIVNEDLLKIKGNILKEKIKNNIPGLFICGAYQFLGKYYKDADGKIIPGLGIFDLYTENPGIKTKRLIGDLIVKSNLSSNYLVGFENHGGRTYLGVGLKPFAQVVSGFGNNGIDKTEGVFYKNSIGTYLHGPILPKNYEVTNFLINKAIENKYKIKNLIKNERDILADSARELIQKRLL